jgi:carbonic anhydrase
MPPIRHTAIRRMLAGVKSFRARYYERDSQSMRQLVEEGQKPDVLFIGCSDSRVDPALLTLAEPGELFVIRNVANMVPPYEPDERRHGTSAAIEYAVRVLKVSHIVVLGHAHCGGVQGLIRVKAGETLPGDFIAPWVTIAEAACAQFIDAATTGLEDETEEKRARTQAVYHRMMESPFSVERAAVKVSVDNLLTFPCIAELSRLGRLNLHGWWFDLDTGDLWTLDHDRGVFVPEN